MKKSGTTTISYDEWLSSLDIQDWNLKAFAREIHENVGQILSLAKMQMATIDPRKVTEAKQIVKQSDLLLAKAIQDLRNLTRQLTPSEIIKRGFAEAARQKLERLKREGSCAVEYHIKGTVFRLDGVKELMLFSILEHYVYVACYEERAMEMNVDITYQPRSISVHIDWKTRSGTECYVPDSKSIGGILKRARLLHAQIRTRESATERGVQIHVKRTSS